MLSGRHITIARALLFALAIGLIVGGLSIPARHFVLGGDSAWPELAPSVAISEYAGSWSDDAGFGQNSALKRPMLLLAVPDLAMERVGIPPLIVNHVWLLLVFLLQALGTVRLLLELFPRARHSLPAILFAAAASLLNPYMLLILHTPYPALDLGMAAAPGMIAAMLAYARGGRTANLVEFFAWCVAGAAADLNPAYPAEQVALLACFGAVMLIWTSGSRRAVATRLAAVLLVYFGVNAPFWLPIAADVGASYSRFASSGQAYTADTFAGIAAFSQIWNVVRLVGGYLFFNPVGGQLYIPDGPAYVGNAIVIIASLALPVLAWSCWWLARKDRDVRVVYALTALALVVLFLTKGLAPPLGAVFGWFADHLTGFSAFRDSFGKFGWILLLCYTLLAARSIVAVEEWPRRRAVPAIACAWLFLAIAAYPILGGRLFWQHAVVDPPPRYEQLAAWAQGQSATDRFMQLPVASVLFDAYDWGYVGGGFESNLTDRSIVSRTYDFAQPVTLGVDDMMQHGRASIGLSRAAAALGALSVTDVITDTSMQPEFYGPSSDPPPVSLADASTVLQLGGIRVLQIDGQFVNPRVYAASRVIVGAQSVRDVAAACGIVSCHDAAFVDRAPNGLAGVFPDRFVFGASGAAPPAAGARLFRRPVTSYGRLGLISGTQPVIVAISASRRAQFSPVWSLATRSRNSRICARAGTTQSLQFWTGALPAPATLALRIDYGTNANAWVNVVGTNPFGNFLVRLPRAHKGTLVRLLRLPAGEPGLTITVVASAGNATQCLRIGDIAMGQAKSARWSLVGTPQDFFVSTPYVAKYAQLFQAAVDTPYRLLRRASSSPATAVRLAAPWNPAEAIAGPSDAVTSTTSGATVTVRVRSAQAAVYAFIDNALPVTSYRVHVPVEGWSGAPPHIVVLAQDGEVLGEQFLTAPARASDVAIDVDSPLDSGRLQVYAYVGSPAGGPSTLTLGAPWAVPEDRDDSIAWFPGTPFGVPSIDVVRRSAQVYDVSVTNAPPQYVLVLNDAFDSHWIATVPAGVTAAHIPVNLDTNGWIVHGAGSYAIRLHYAGGAPAIAGVLLALCALCGAGALHVTRGRRT